MKKILNATTKILDKNFNCDIWDEHQEQGFEDSCFYVSIVPISSYSSTNITIYNEIAVSIKYFGKSKQDCYSKSEVLRSLFSLGLIVEDTFLNTSKVDSTFVNDGVGETLEFLIYTGYSVLNGRETIIKTEDIDTIEKMEEIIIKR